MFSYQSSRDPGVCAGTIQFIGNEVKRKLMTCADIFKVIHQHPLHSATTRAKPVLSLQRLASLAGSLHGSICSKFGLVKFPPAADGGNCESLNVPFT